jgi:hypothetical protein
MRLIGKVLSNIGAMQHWLRRMLEEGAVEKFDLDGMKRFVQVAEATEEAHAGVQSLAEFAGIPTDEPPPILPAQTEAPMQSAVEGAGPVVLATMLRSNVEPEPEPEPEPVWDIAYTEDYTREEVAQLMTALRDTYKQATRDGWPVGLRYAMGARERDLETLHDQFDTKDRLTGASWVWGARVVLAALANQIPIGDTSASESE